MAVKVPPVKMGELCECGRGGRVPSNLVVCYDCLEDRRLAFWEIYNREAAEWRARMSARPGRPGTIPARVGVTRGGRRDG
jgi:hypothetical protein